MTILSLRNQIHKILAINYRQSSKIKILMVKLGSSHSIRKETEASKVKEATNNAPRQINLQNI